MPFALSGFADQQANDSRSPHNAYLAQSSRKKKEEASCKGHDAYAYDIRTKITRHPPYRLRNHGNGYHL
jgi:hypothetical protein